MLVFDYQCTNCDNNEEHYVKTHDEVPHCTKCGHSMGKEAPSVGLLVTNSYDKSSARKPR